MTTHIYHGQHDAHVGSWLKHKFGLTIEWMNCEYHCWLGDYDLDVPHGYSDTRFGAAQDYAASYNEKLHSILYSIEHGETP